MDNGKTIDFMQHVNSLKKNSLKEQLAGIELKLGQARLEDDLIRVKELERERARVIAEMNPVINTESPYPAPLSEDAYYGIAGRTVRAIEPQTEADSIALLMTFLTCFGIVVGRRPYYLVGATRHYLKLFIALVGDTAKGRKGMSWDIIKYIFERVSPDWVKDRIKNGLSSGEGLIASVQDDIYKDVQDPDTGFREAKLVACGIEDKRLLVIESELAQTLKVMSRESNILSPIIRSAWDSGKLQTMTKHDPLKATDTHIGIIGHITRSEVSRALTSTERGNGFANRFLWLCISRSKSLPFGGNFDLIDFDEIERGLKEAIAFAEKAEEITWAEETRDRWAEIYPILSEGKEGMVGAITARAEAQVVRVASIYALLDLSNKIKPEHLWAALAVWEYSFASVKYIFQETTTDPLVGQIYILLFDNPQGLGRDEINTHLGKHKTSNEIGSALDTLHLNGTATFARIKTGGRDKEVWTLVENAEVAGAGEVQQ